MALQLLYNGKLMGCFPYDLVDKSWTICSLIDEFGHEIA